MPSFETYLRAGFPVIWVNSLEPHRVQRDLAGVARQVREGAEPMCWDIVGGLRKVDGEPQQSSSPAQAIKAVAGTEKTVAFFWNLHRFLGGPDVIQAIQNAIEPMKARGSCIVVLAPDHDKLPQELARHVVTWDFPLPNEQVLIATAQRVAADAGLVLEEGEPLRLLVDAARGLTAAEAEDAMALAFVEKRRLDPGVVAREKAGALLRQAKISMVQYPERFGDLGGLDNLKRFTLATAPSPLALGIFLLGVPGAGKSTFARCLGNELGIPTLSMDFGKMLGSLVGSSEGAIRDALKSVDAMGRVVLFIDEIDKGLAGAGSSGELDSGVKAGVAGTFLKWLSDRTPGRAYVIATANKVSSIPPEYLRSERWDGLFYVDLPTRSEKDAIWAIWGSRFRLSVTQDRPDDESWTGAEIRTCCRIAAMMDCTKQDAASYVVPVARSMAEAVEQMRTWAKGRCLPASLPAPGSALSATGRRLLG